MQEQRQAGEGKVCLPGRRNPEKKGQDKALGGAPLREAMEEGKPRRAQWVGWLGRQNPELGLSAFRRPCESTVWEERVTYGWV